MSMPAYAEIDERERGEAVRNAPDNREREEAGRQKSGKGARKKR
jgi:hypothetical protein